MKIRAQDASDTSQGQVCFFFFTSFTLLTVILFIEGCYTIWGANNDKKGLEMCLMCFKPRYFLEVFIMPLWFLPESGHSCGIQWNPVESFLAGSPAKIAIPGTSYSGGIEPFWNWAIPELSHSGIETGMVLEWTGTESGGMQLNRFIYFTIIFFIFCQMYYVFATSRVDCNHVHQHQRRFNINPHKRRWQPVLTFKTQVCFFCFLFPFLFCLLIII